MDPIETDNGVSRRKLLVAGAGTAVGVATLAACGGSSTPATSSGTSAGPSESGSPASGGGGTGALAKLSDVPVGGGISAKGPDGAPVIVSQPTEGNVVAFSAICTHKGCTVAPEGSIIKCPCHGSTYDLATGKNTGGPAPSPLTEIPVTVTDGEVVES